MKKIYIILIFMNLLSCSHQQALNNSLERKIASNDSKIQIDSEIIFLNQVGDNYNLKLSGDDAEAVYSVLDKKLPREIFSFQSINCTNKDNCIVSIRSERYAKFVGREAQKTYTTNYGIVLNETLDNWLKQDSDRLLYSPVQSYFLHGGLAPFIKFSSKIYSQMAKSKSKYIFKSRGKDADIITLKSPHLDWACWKFDKPKEILVDDFSIPHGPVLASHHELETHGCRFFTKLNLDKKNEPTLVLNPDVDLSLSYKLLRKNGTLDAVKGLQIGVDFMQFIGTSFNPLYRDYVILGKTDEQGFFKFDKKWEYFYNEIEVNSDHNMIGFGTNKFNIADQLIKNFNLPTNCSAPLSNFISVYDIRENGDKGYIEGVTFLTAKRLSEHNNTIEYNLSNEYYHLQYFVISGGYSFESKKYLSFDEALDQYLENCK